MGQLGIYGLAGDLLGWIYGPAGDLWTSWGSIGFDLLGLIYWPAGDLLRWPQNQANGLSDQRSAVTYKQKLAQRAQSLNRLPDMDFEIMAEILPISSFWAYSLGL